MEHLADCPALPRLIWKGTLDTPLRLCKADAKVIVMEKQGASFSQLLDLCGGRFSLKSTLMLAEECITRLEEVHKLGVIHRDLKPANFIMGYDDPSRCYLIDFGLAAFYKRESGKHIKLKNGLKPCGTVRYASINCHHGTTLARRDDLEALGHVLIYMVRPGLPWQRKPRNKGDKKVDKWVRILNGKLNTELVDLCKELPKEFATYMSYCRGLEFAEQPDYNYCRQLFRSAFKKGGFENDYLYDWSKFYQK